MTETKILDRTSIEEIYNNLDMYKVMEDLLDYIYNSSYTFGDVVACIDVRTGEIAYQFLLHEYGDVYEDYLAPVAKLDADVARASWIRSCTKLDEYKLIKVYIDDMDTMNFKNHFVEILDDIYR